MTDSAPDTIVAIATPPGRGGVGIIRVSGPLAGSIGAKIFRAKQNPPLPWPSHQLFYGEIFDSTERVIDDGYVVRMEKPHSYTGEEVVEIYGHGSPVALQEIIGLCLREGARLAGPGEFTKRAFLNGKIDLVQAEAVAELIDAESEAEAKSARQRIKGKLSGALHELREKTIAVLAECEADVDFPEEDLSLASHTGLMRNFEQIQILASKIRSTYEANQRLHQGLKVVLIGRPNVGKSSLFNALLNHDRAIVTPIAGTTRDALHEDLILSGRRIRLIDTAGLRDESKDDVEKIGMERTSQEATDADLIFFIADASEGLHSSDVSLLEGVSGKPIWWIWNKVDLKVPPSTGVKGERVFPVSAKSGEGIESLQNALSERVVELTTLEIEGGISNDRQRQLLDKYLTSLKRTEEELKKNASPEFVAFELRQAHQAISRILGRDEGAEEILGEIFSRFCIGK